jgi:hypothetical protein
MTREEQINKAVENLLDSAGVDMECRDVPRLWFKLGANYADNHPVSYINWQQVRIQAAIAAMQLIQTDETFKRWVKERVDEGGVYYEEYSNVAVEIADHLIVALKQKPWVLKQNGIEL